MIFKTMIDWSGVRMDGGIDLVLAMKVLQGFMAGGQWTGLVNKDLVEPDFDIVFLYNL